MPFDIAAGHLASSDRLQLNKSVKIVPLVALLYHDGQHISRTTFVFVIMAQQVHKRLTLLRRSLKANFDPTMLEVASEAL